jgi:hypothetical protein
LASPLSAQRAVASGDVHVRTGQSASSRILDTLFQGDTVTLLSRTKTKGYYHIQEANGTKGWAYARYLDTIPSGPIATNPSNPAPPTNGVATTIDPAWNKTPSNAAAFAWPDGNHATCAAAGTNGDDATNLMKNRTDSSTTYHSVTWDALESLEFPRNKGTHRSDTAWTPSRLAVLAKYEGTPISVEAFLSGIKEQIPENDPTTGLRKKGEATNCQENTSPRVDWHMYLTKGPNQSHHFSIVVETTPRVRPSHPGWTIGKIQALSTAGTPVRISGWLMFDPEHWDQMWQYKGLSDTTGTKARITLWEIHPITKIEVKQNGQWKSLDSP